MFKVVDLHKQVMIEVTEIKVKKGSIATKGKMMGTMPGTFYLTPEELWNMVKMVSLSLICWMPILIVKGMWRSWTRSGGAKKA